MERGEQVNELRGQVYHLAYSCTVVQRATTELEQGHIVLPEGTDSLAPVHVPSPTEAVTPFGLPYCSSRDTALRPFSSLISLL